VSAMDTMNEYTLAMIASAIRKWTSQLEHAGLPPMRMVSQDEMDAVLDLMGHFPKESLETEPCEE